MPDAHATLAQPTYVGSPDTDNAGARRPGVCFTADATRTGEVDSYRISHNSLPAFLHQRRRLVSIRASAADSDCNRTS